MTYHRDARVLKHFVCIVWLVASAQQGMFMRLIWFYILPPVAFKYDKNHPSWSTIPYLVPAEVVTLVVECFFLYRIWSLTHRKKTVLVLLLPTVCAFGFRIIHIAEYAGHPYLMHAAKQKWFVITYAISRIITDLTIVVWMIWLVAYEKRTESTPSSSQRRIERVFDYLFATGLLNSILTVTMLILYFALPPNAFSVLYFVYPKLYLNSMLASLNSREPPRKFTEVTFITSADFS